MNDTPTPRTDEFERATCCGNESSLKFARKLETELTAVTEQRDRMAEAIITHRAKAFPLTGEDFDQELWRALQSLTPNEL